MMDGRAQGSLDPTRRLTPFTLGSVKYYPRRTLCIVRTLSSIQLPQKSQFAPTAAVNIICLIAEGNWVFRLRAGGPELAVVSTCQI